MYLNKKNILNKKEYINDKDDIDFELKNRNIYPDIIFHERKKTNNIFIIEVKKSTEKEYLIEYDNLKLEKYKNELGYSFCFLLIIHTKSYEMDEIQYKKIFNKKNYYDLKLLNKKSYFNKNLLL